MIKIVPAIDLFNDDELTALECVVMNLPPLRPLYGPHREFPRFIDLPRTLEERARLPYENVKRVEYDVEAESVRLYF
jgi:hypothetical protein